MSRRGAPCRPAPTLLPDAQAGRATMNQGLEAQLIALLDALPAWVSYLGLDGRYVWVNRAYMEMYGEPRESFLGKTVLEFSMKEARPG